MQKRAPALSCFALAIVCALILTACGGGSGNSRVTSVAITPTTANVALNGTTDFTAVVNLTNSSTAASTSTVVTWEVNGVAGGSTTTGTIAPDPSDEQVGIYTAPAVVPSTNNGVVSITAVAPENPDATTSTTSSATVTSNTASVTIGAGTGLAITELTSQIPAGSNHQFNATLNGLNDPNATWSVSSTNGGNIGTINALSGLYTAPPFPPPGGSITITATDPTVNTPATATAEIVYSNLSLNGPFAFSYAGNDSDGFLAVAGSFIADGQGDITSGIEDVDSFLSGVQTALPFTGTYVVGPDGRTTATIDNGHGTATWQFVLTTNQHAFLIRFDTNKIGSGSGTLDQQNLNDLTTSPTIVEGPYALSASGLDASFKPMAMAGEFTSNGSGGFPTSGSMLDVNDGGTITTQTPAAAGSYAFDAANSGTGRGTLTLPGTAGHQLEFAYYVIDSTHLHIVEIDGNAFLAGDLYTGATSTLSGTYVFAAGGTSSTVTGGAYAEGGDFISNGSGGLTGGDLDTNDGGTVTTDTAISGGTYTVNGATGRIDLKLSGTSEFALYQTAANTAVMVELDSAAVSTGLAYSQVTADATTVPAAGNFAFVLGGQGMFHEVSGSAQPDTEGQLTLAGTAFSAGNFDINNFNATYKTDPVNTTNSIVAAPDSNGRGTLTLEGQNPDITYKLVYYVIDGNTALFFDQDMVRVAIGTFARQF